MSKTLLSWYEPYFFVPRLRTLNGWLWRLVWLVGIALVVFLFEYGLGGPRPLSVELGIALVTGVLLTLLPDLVFLQRDVWITGDAIEWEAYGVKFRVNGSFPHSQITCIEFHRSGEWRFKFGGMRIFLPDGQWFFIAIPNRKKLETIAAVLTRQGVTVTLSGWEPTTADTRTRVEDELSLESLPASTQDAVFAPIPSEEPKLRTTPGMVVAALIGAGPLLIGLLGMIGTWIYLGMYWGQLIVRQRWMIGGGGVAGFVFSFLFLLFIGQFIEKAMLIRMAQQLLRTRLHPLVDAEDDDVYAVSIYRREIWSKVASWADDFGFLQVNRRKRAIVFEGDKERWIIPLTALTAVRMEEADVGKEGADSSEIRYFVVLGTSRDGEPWEIGLIHARTQWGHDGATARRERMGVLFDELRTAVSLVSLSPP